MFMMTKNKNKKQVTEASGLPVTSYWARCPLLKGLGKPEQNLEAYDYRAVLFAYSLDKQRFSSHKKF